MARAPKSTVEAALCHLFPSIWLEAHARATGMVQRQRKVNPISLFWTLVLSFGIGKEHRLVSLRRSYEAATGVLLSASSFYDRFSQQLVTFLQQACQRAVDQVTMKGPVFQGALSAFHDVLITDATVLRLHELLKNSYAACRTNHTQAAAKLHLVHSVFGKSDQRIQLTAQRRHEARVLKIGDWVKDRLLLFDLGYFSYALLDCIHQRGGFFVSRLKQGCTPILVAVHQGSDRGLVGQSLPSVLCFIRREVLDAQVEVAYKKRKYRGKRRSVIQQFRLVGIRNPLTREYHLYLTNLPVSLFSGRVIAQLYSARWLIEILFKQLKSCYQLEALSSQNEHVVHALIYAALITMLVSQRIEQELRQRVAQEKDNPCTLEETIFPLLRLGAVLMALSAKLLVATLKQAGVKRHPLSLTELICKEAKDPNHRRDTLPQILQKIGTENP